MWRGETLAATRNELGAEETWPADWLERRALPGTRHASKIHVAVTFNKRGTGDARVAHSQRFDIFE
jgi:hypothetical protein